MLTSGLFAIGITGGLIAIAITASRWWSLPHRAFNDTPQLGVTVQWDRILKATASDGAWLAALEKARDVEGGTCLSVTYVAAQGAKVLKPSRGLVHCFTAEQLERAHRNNPLIVEVTWLRSGNEVGVVVDGHVHAGVPPTRVYLTDGAREVRLPYSRGWFIGILPTAPAPGLLHRAGRYAIRVYRRQTLVAEQSLQRLLSSEMKRKRGA